MGKRDKAILVTITRNERPEVIDEHLHELAFLARTAGLNSVGKVVQGLTIPDARTYIGKGKLEALKEQVIAEDIAAVVFDDDLSPSQLRNLERALDPADREEKLQVYDRSLLILDIFLKGAHTARARPQVDLP